MMGEADFQNFSDMSDLELEMTLLQAGVPVTGENFLTMMGRGMPENKNAESLSA